MIDPKILLPLSKEKFAEEMGLSGSLLQRFSEYRDLLEKWQKRINLVSRSTLPDLWRRHFLDSAQLLPMIPKSADTLVDLGSGAGFPGLVLALLISEHGGPEVHLVEADGRKAAFLAEANRILETGAVLHSRRIESITGLKADVITARALSPLERLLNQAERFMGAETTCLFLKGEKVSHELTIARKQWTMTVTEVTSITHDLARILKLKDVKRVG